MSAPQPDNRRAFLVAILGFARCALVEREVTRPAHEKLTVKRAASQ